MENVSITRIASSRIGEVNWNRLGFGQYFSDHMFVADYVNGEWGDYRIVPYGPMPMAPGNCTLHYGQTIFEGLKAFRTKNGHANIFRPEMNAIRLNRSAGFLCIPPFDVDTLVEAMAELVRVDQQWIPKKHGESLYLRPLMFGTDEFLGVRPSQSYRLVVMGSPVGSYYEEGINPVRIMVACHHTRAVKGGLGAAKTAANYAASLQAAVEAKHKGFAQVLWLDGVTHEFVDEVGTMNIMFLIDNELITPPLDDGTILAGITRDSVLTLGREMGLKVSERRISIDEVLRAYDAGLLQEVFGTGTAAVISPVGELEYSDRMLRINDMKIGPVAQKLYDTITGIQYGEIEDAYNWTVRVDLEEHEHELVEA